LFDCSDVLVSRSFVDPSLARRSRPIALVLFAVVTVVVLAVRCGAGRNFGKSEHGTIQGTLRDEDGKAWRGESFYTSPETETRVWCAQPRRKYVSEPLPRALCGAVEGRNMRLVESRVAVVLGTAAKADFSLQWISPGPARLESKFSGEVPDNLPINGAIIWRGGLSRVCSGGWSDFRSGQSGLQSLSIDGSSGRTTHFDMDQVEAMDETRAGDDEPAAEAVQEVSCRGLRRLCFSR